jgi:hypothetical protein
VLGFDGQSVFAMSATPANVPTNRAIDRLIKSANLEKKKKVVTLNDGTEFSMWLSPLVLAEREAAQKQVKEGGYNSVALQLLVDKATDENGRKLFAPAEIDTLKLEVRESDLNKLLLAVIADEDDEPIDVKN